MGRMSWMGEKLKPSAPIPSRPALPNVGGLPQATQMAVVVLATAPIVCIYPLLQRYFVKGVLTGAVKA